MKKITLLFFAIALFSCTVENDFIYQEKEDTVSKSNKRTLDEAIKVAQNAISFFGSKSRSEGYRTIDMETFNIYVRMKIPEVPIMIHCFGTNHDIF